MIWLYRLQQRFSITRTESIAMLTLVALFNVGLAARYVQEQPRLIPPETYRAGDRLFERGSALAAADEPPTDAPGEMPTPASNELPAGEPPVVVNINTATAAKLQQLRGVGPKTAASILAYREKRGGFRRTRELMRVRGIGPKTLQKLEAHIAVQ